MHPDAMKEAMNRRRMKGVDLTIVLGGHEKPDEHGMGMDSKEEADEEKSEDVAPEPISDQEAKQLPDHMKPKMGEEVELEHDPHSGKLMAEHHHQNAMEEAMQAAHHYDLHGKKPRSLSEKVTENMNAMKGKKGYGL